MKFGEVLELLLKLVFGVLFIGGRVAQQQSASIGQINSRVFGSRPAVKLSMRLTNQLQIHATFMCYCNKLFSSGGQLTCSPSSYRSGFGQSAPNIRCICHHSSTILPDFTPRTCLPYVEIRSNGTLFRDNRAAHQFTKMSWMALLMGARRTVYVDVRPPTHSPYYGDSCGCDDTRRTCDLTVTSYGGTTSPGLLCSCDAYTFSGSRCSALTEQFVDIPF